MISKIIGALIAVVIGLALLPVANDFVEDLTVAPVTDGTDVLTTGGRFYDTSTGSLIDLLPILFVIIIVGGIVGAVIWASKKA